MYFNNEKKNSFGSFSQAGKISAKQFQMIVNKDKILNNNKKNNKLILNNFLKRNGYNNIFLEENKKDRFLNSNDDDDLNDSNLNILEDEINIFEIESKKLKKSTKKTKKNFSAFHRTNNNNYKYHDQHMFDLKIINEKLNKEKNNNNKKDLFSVSIPSRNFIWKKSPMPTEWKNMPKREILYTKINDAKIYLNQEDLLKNMAGKSFVDMNKQTVRGDFFGDDLRTYVQKKYEEENDFKRSMSEKLYENNKFSRNKKIIRPLSMTTNFSSNNNNNKENCLFNNENDDDDSSEQNDSYNKFKEVYQKQFKKNKKNYIKLNNVKSSKSMSSKSSQISNFSNKIQHSKTSKNFFKKNKQKNEIKAPNFKTIISREYLNKLKDKNKFLVPFFLPNFNQVRERTIMMVDYKDKKKRAKTPNKYFKGIEPFYFNNYNKYFSKFNNHVEIHSPNFKKMVSRPIDNNPLPSYMKKLFNRNAIYSINEQSLKMNNYSNGKFLQNSTDFFPKKSFNKIINLNLLNSDVFINKKIAEKIKNENDKDYLIKSMRFYRKNYDDLIKESELNKFDNITLKTIKKESVLKQEEIECFFKNYQQEINKKK